MASNQGFNFQYYVNSVKEKEIPWHVFEKLMEDFSYSDVNRLKCLNAILLTELTISNSDMDRLKYLNVILMAKLKDSIQIETKENNPHLEHYQKSTEDYDWNDETTEEILSSDDEIQTSTIRMRKNETKENFDADLILETKSKDDISDDIEILEIRE